jgi:hypothetical protein
MVTRLAPELESLGADVEVVLAHAPFGFPTDQVAGAGARAANGFRAAIRRDVLHVHGGVSWAPLHADGAWARMWRRTVVASYYGDDCRLAEVARVRFPARGRVTDPARDAGVRRRLSRLGRLAHAAIAADLELATYLRPYFPRIYLVPVPVPPRPPALATPPRSDRPRPVVLHIPSDPQAKGTREIQAAVDAVAARVPLEFRLVPRVHHDRVLEELAAADVLVDQLNSATTGVLALEAMQLGLSVLCEFDRRALAPFQEDTPAIAVTPQSLAGELESLLGDPARRAELGERGRRFVPSVHAAGSVAASVLRVYADAPRARPGLYEVGDDGIRALAWPEAEG